MQNYKITLMDGRELLCPLKKEQPKEVRSDNFELDTTGEYLSFGNRKPKVATQDMMQKAKRQYDNHLLTENAWLLLENAEKIFSDPKLFLSRVRVQNGLAYTGISGFRCPTLGVYLEWWLNHKEASIDGSGNLVWAISGSPLSGSNCCYSVTPEGEQVKINQRCSFSKIWSSFVEVNTRYTDAKQLCEAYTLEEALILLHGEDYKYRLIELQHEMIEKELDRDRRVWENQYHRLLTRMGSLLKKNRSYQLRQNRAKILDFYAGYEERAKEVKRLETLYAKRHRDLKQQLHDGTLEGDYKALLSDCSREYKEKKRMLSESLTQFIRDTFGKNPNHISHSDIIRYATNKPLSLPLL